MKSRVELYYSALRDSLFFYLNSGETADESNKSNKEPITESPSL